MRTSNPFAIFMVILAMGLAMYAVPFPESLLFVVAIVGGGAIAFSRIRKARGGNSD